VLIVGDCWTMSDPPRAGAVLLDGDRIIEVGDAAALATRRPGVQRVQVSRVTPGLHDAHVHPVAWGQALVELRLDGITDPRAAAERVAERAAVVPPGSWIRGGGYLFDHHPDGALLDAAAPQHPVLLTSRDMHGGWANRAALERAGLTRGAADPAGGVLLRDSDGTPTGALLEGAVGAVAAAVPPPSRADLERGLADLARRGYTAAHAMTFEPAGALAWYEELARAGRLPLRVWYAVAREAWRSTAPGRRSDDLDVAAVKLFVDGALGSRTAWMHEPYADGAVGLNVAPLDEIEHELRAAVAAGWGAAVHAIGTRAVAEAITVLGRVAPGAARPLRLEHVQHVRDVELARLPGLAVALSLQPVHLLGDAELVRRHLPGKEREAFRLRDLAATGRPVAFGSDAPVAHPDPADALRAATAHPLSPEQSVGEAEALAAFTRGAASAAGWRDCGVLAHGSRADLTLWEDGRVVGRVYRGRLDWLA
jgi:predicted amidohydrolase YtcJ